MDDREHQPKLVSVSEKLGVVESFLDKGFDDVTKSTEIELKEIPEEVEKIAREIARLGGRVFLEGGCVRDAAIRTVHPEMKVDTKDYDMEVYGLKYQDVMRFLKTEFGDGNVTVTGANFGVIRIKIPGKVLQLEMGVPRSERKVGEGHKGFETKSAPWMNMQEAAIRRDLTMNSMLYDPLTRTLYDPYGGLKDIEFGIIRANDLETFKEDPLRVLRVMQFVGRFGFTVSDELMGACKELIGKGELEPLAESTVKAPKVAFVKSNEVLAKSERGFVVVEGSRETKRVLVERQEKGISAERLTEEVTKMLLKAIEPSSSMEFLRETGYIKKYWPEMYALIGLRQGEMHPEGDVWTHTLEAMNAARLVLNREYALGRIKEEDRGLVELVVMLSAMLHDVAKVNRPNGDGFDFHDQAARPILKKFFSKMSHKDIGDQARVQVMALVKDHMNFLALWERIKAGEDSERSARRMFLRLNGDKATIGATLYLMAIVSEADTLARNPDTDKFEPIAMDKGFGFDSTDWAFEKSRKIAENEKIRVKIPRENILRSLDIDLKKLGGLIGVIFKCLDQDEIDGVVAANDITDLKHRAVQYRDAFLVIARSKVELDGKSEKEVWREILSLDDPRSILETVKSL
ncbi:MAG: Polynucleotide adenylyltransferase/metal-dependent phosphohydrolase [Candidatus Collierbacteria bacterium GW2011_GWC2_44_18]|uniref:Polynucleotide adenylyltransferase/metal-dependent phosphohydrolase n=2 Tax=Microgenomates group TaxID=1794810 RepID=A0A0G1J4T7_9BACT|nr:MAG: Polynucleotide adenylyltransferase/metal-dependent phosphohydrolase [Microgenomates group bacterium GW2011_GWC1_44_10]KKT48872.1 MAG: Polynucleotide adenylyltransferase/metal-dependent phosphohydrolase [Candidatus Collierbacteria bacterium GW2011_GWC2_44_18]KKT66295.1 MAG: Polynucleotide adenylyltransferase/metal-dependent phosphohydrolase [Candidatus Woesebacteria bacterium GW2011_GWA2_44_33]